MALTTPREATRGVKRDGSMKDTSMRLHDVFDSNTLYEDHEVDEHDDDEPPQRRRRSRNTKLNMLERRPADNNNNSSADPSVEEDHSVQSGLTSASRRTSRGGRHRLTSATKRTSISQDSALGLSANWMKVMNGSGIHSEDEKEQLKEPNAEEKPAVKPRSRRLSERVRSRRSVTSDASTVQTSESTMTNNSRNSKIIRVRSQRGESTHTAVEHSVVPSRKPKAEKPLRTRSFLSKESADSTNSAHTTGVEHETTIAQYEKPPLRRNRTGGSEILMASASSSNIVNGSQSRRRTSSRRREVRSKSITTGQSESVDQRRRAAAAEAHTKSKEPRKLSTKPATEATSRTQKPERKSSTTPKTPRSTRRTLRKSTSVEAETPENNRRAGHRRSVTSYGEMQLKTTPSSEKRRTRSADRKPIASPTATSKQKTATAGKDDTSRRKTPCNSKIERLHASCSKIPSYSNERRRRQLRKQLSRSSVKSGDVHSPCRTNQRPKRSNSQESFHESFVVMSKQDVLHSSHQKLEFTTTTTTTTTSTPAVESQDPPETASGMNGSQLMVTEFETEFDGSDISSSEDEGHPAADNSSGANGRRMRESSRRMRDSTSGRSKDSGARSRDSSKQRDSGARMRDSSRMRETSSRLRDASSRRRDASARRRESSRRRRDNGGRRSSTNRRTRHRSTDTSTPDREMANNSKETQENEQESSDGAGNFRGNDSFEFNEDVMGEVLQFDPTQIGMVQRVKQISSDKKGYEINGQVGQIAEIVDPVSNLQDFIPSKGPLFNLFDEDPGFGEDMFHQPQNPKEPVANQDEDSDDSQVSHRRKSLIRRGGATNDEDEGSDNEGGRRESGALRDFINPATLGYEDPTPKEKSKSTLQKASGYLRNMLHAAHAETGDGDDDKSQISHRSSRSNRSEKSGKSARKSIKALFTKKNKGTLLLDEDISLSDSDGEDGNNNN